MPKKESNISDDEDEDENVPVPSQDQAAQIDLEDTHDALKIVLQR